LPTPEEGKARHWLLKSVYVQLGGTMRPAITCGSSITGDGWLQTSTTWGMQGWSTLEGSELAASPASTIRNITSWSELPSPRFMSFDDVTSDPMLAFATAAASVSPRVPLGVL